MCGNLLFGAGKQAKNDAAYALAQEKITSQQAAQKADALAAQTQNQVKTDEGLVDQNFSQFNPDYYNNYRSAYTGYYTPQAADQYKQARDQLTAALAGNGTLESSAGATALANLAKRETDQVAQIQGQADTAVNAQRGKIANAQNGLYSLANAAVDPTQIASNATAQTTALAAPQTYAPLGNVFTDLVTPFSNYTKSAANGAISGIPLINTVQPAAYGQNTGNGSPIVNPG